MLKGSDFRAIIFNAARENNLDRMKVFLDEERSIDWIEDCLNGSDNEKNCLVIASRYGFLDIVRYLHGKGADVTIRGTVSFDGEVISSAPALWAASAAGHFEVVKYLVDVAGADINQTTATNSTPLRGACYDGHLEIVQYLVEHGANIEIANRHGHTPLMISCFRGKSDVANYLLAQGADIHKQSYKGNTALHDAAEGDRADICKMLIDGGAVLKEDDTGLCPLMSCSILGNDSTLAVLLSICTSGIKKRDALKLLGCTLCDKKMNMHGAIRSWRAATAVILTEMEQIQYDEMLKGFTIPEVYGEIQEIDTEQDVDFIDGQPDLIHMQSLLIRERILGKGHTEVHYFIRFRGAVYCDLSRVTKCFELWMHALHLQQEHLEPMNGNTYATFQAFQETYALAANEHRINQDIGRQQWPVEKKQVLDLLDMLCYELERVKRFTIIEPVPDVNATRLVNICRRLNILPLHLALQEAVDRTDPQVRDEFPSLYVVQQLLKSGADVDTIDFMRNTPLHVLLLNERPRESIVRVLLDSGAPILARNDQDSTCSDLMELSNLKNIPCGHYISLMGLAANAVNRSGDSCLAMEIIPECLHNFLAYH